MRISCDVRNLTRIKFSTLLGCLCAQYYHWLRPTVMGLKIVDTDGDTQITGDEFMAYVQGSERVNQKWLSRATEEQPCMLRNAQCDSHIRSHSSAMSAYMHACTCHIPCTVGMMTHCRCWCYAGTTTTTRSSLASWDSVCATSARTRRCAIVGISVDYCHGPARRYC